MPSVTERFEAAVSTLISDGPVKQRLVRAYAEYLEDISEVDIPAQSGEVLASLHGSLHGVRPVGRETAVQASVQKMSANEAAGHAAVILSLYRDLIADDRRGEHLKIVKTAGESEAPPSYLVGAK
jgi:hypothetical protein